MRGMRLSWLAIFYRSLWRKWRGIN